MTENKTDTLQTIRDTLRFHQAMGIEEYPFNQDVQRFLKIAERPKKKTDEQISNVFDESIASQGLIAWRWRSMTVPCASFLMIHWVEFRGRERSDAG